MTVLVVEDDLLTLQRLRRFLERLGYVVLEASNGAEALATFVSTPGGVDIVVTDWNMNRPCFPGGSFI